MPLIVLSSRSRLRLVGKTLYRGLRPTASKVRRRGGPARERRRPAPLVVVGRRGRRSLGEARGSGRAAAGTSSNVYLVDWVPLRAIAGRRARRLTLCEHSSTHSPT